MMHLRSIKVSSSRPNHYHCALVLLLTSGLPLHSAYRGISTIYVFLGTSKMSNFALITDMRNFRRRRLPAFHLHGTFQLAGTLPLCLQSVLQLDLIVAEWVSRSSRCPPQRQTQRTCAEIRILNSFHCYNPHRGTHSQCTLLLHCRTQTAPRIRCIPARV
ncbi:hypothetical protein BDZ97DRAFT_131240 [Flammula alnicola]|nr:hypothetical protein BDZ97DRAFT_131240 [Flammula alnicola]